MKSKHAYTLAALAQHSGAAVEGDGSLQIDGAAPIDSAQPGDLSFVANSKYEKLIPETKASALVLDTSMPAHGHAALRHDLPYLTFAKIVTLLYPASRPVAGIDPRAVVDPTALVDASASIGPFVAIGERTMIGAGVVIESNATIGSDVRIGTQTCIHSGVRIADQTVIGTRCRMHPNVVIGADGFGFAESPTGLFKVPQIGHVEIGDDVEIGANSTIDRGALGPTVIGSGSKIDNLVMIAHNVRIGQHCVIVAQTGISGSTKLGNGVILGGQVGVIGHIEIGDGARVGAKSGIHNSVPAGATLFGYPAREIMLTKRIEASLNRLPELFKRVRAIEERDKS